MNIIEFDRKETIQFVMCGKFSSPNPEWIHFRRELLEFEMMLVTDGTLYISDGTMNYTIQKGEYVIIPPTKSQYGTKASSCSFYWLHFSCEHSKGTPTIYSSLEDITRQKEYLLIPVTAALTSIERVIILMKQLQDCEKRYHDPILRNSLTVAILAETANQCSTLRKFTSPYSGEQLYHDIRDYIHHHATQNQRIGQISDYFGYSQKYLTSFFHKHSGCSIKQYVLQCKMEIAKAELTDSNHTVSQVAYNIGFRDVHNFSNAFKKIGGLSPLDYKNSFTKRTINSE